MIHDTETFTTRRVASETTEDGDLLITFEVRAKGFTGINNFQAAHNRVIEVWYGAGNGWMRSTFHVLVDGAEVAIETRNDAWASVQQEIEDHGRAMAGAWA